MKEMNFHVLGYVIKILKTSHYAKKDPLKS